MTHRVSGSLWSAEKLTHSINSIWILGLLLSFFPIFAFDGLQSTVSSGRTENSVSLSFEVEKRDYRKDEIVLIKYRVANKRNENIFLVVDEPVTPGYEDTRKELSAVIQRVILTYHSFSYPKLKRIKPGGEYHSETKLPLEFLGRKFLSGKWRLYLTLGYLNAKGMSDLTQLLKRFEPDGLAKEFDVRQEFLNAGPVEINLQE